MSKKLLIIIILLAIIAVLAINLFNFSNQDFDGKFFQMVLWAARGNIGQTMMIGIFLKEILLFTIIIIRF